MLRRPLVMTMAALTAFVVLSATSIANPVIGPSTITLQRGTTTSTDPITQVHNSDDVYYSVTATQARGTFAMRYIANFDLGSATPASIFLIWEGQAQFSCDLKLALYNFRRKRYVVGASGYIVNNDDRFTQRAFPDTAFIRNHKVRARITCSSQDAFDLLTDLLALQYS